MYAGRGPLYVSQPHIGDLVFPIRHSEMGPKLSGFLQIYCTFFWPWYEKCCHNQSVGGGDPINVATGGQPRGSRSGAIGQVHVKTVVNRLGGPDLQSSRVSTETHQAAAGGTGRERIALHSLIARQVH